MKTEPTEAFRAMANDLKYNVGVIHSNPQLILEESFISGVRYGQSSPKIKQLEWENHGSSITAVGLSDYEYCVNLKDDHTTLSLRNNSQIIVLGPYSRPNEAKAAAQRDFEKRIKECLE